MAKAYDSQVLARRPRLLIRQSGPPEWVPFSEHGGTAGFFGPRPTYEEIFQEVITVGGR